ncbi:MAG TPA: GAF domain-containing protein, partial [Anaerolineae bacterium]|nr:GAF domain-containing protein [Anaerolineae bacterium]
MNREGQRFTSLPPRRSGRSPTAPHAHNLRWRLLGLLGSVLVLALLTIAAGVSFFVSATEQSAWQDRQREAARHAGEVVTAFIQRAEGYLTLIGTLDRVYLQVQRHIMADLLQHEPALLEVIRVAADGDIFASAYQDAPVLANLFTVPQSTWFLEASAGRTYIGKVRISSGDEPFVILAVPSPRGGVVAARLRLRLLWDVTAGIRFGETGGAYVVDREGQVLAHADPNVVLNNTTIMGRPEMNAVLQSPDGAWSGSYTNFRGVQVTGSTVSIPDIGWVVITELPQSEAFAISRTALAWLGSGALLVGLFLLWVAARLLARFVFQPLAQLQTGAGRVGQGDLSYRLDLNRRDEMGQVAAAFNQMAEQLQGLTGSLEAQVAARTAQLKAGADVGRAAASILDPDQLVREVVNLITDRFGFYYAAVFLLDEGGKFAVLSDATGEAGRILKQRGHQLEVGGQSMVGFVTAQRKARIALDVGQDAVRFANPLLPETRSEIALPLVAGDRVLGALDVQSMQAAAFDEASAAVLQGMADQIAVALNNAALYSALHLNVETLNSLLALSRDIARSRSLQELTQGALRNIQPILGADDYYVALVDEQQTEVRFVLQQRTGADVHDQVNVRPFGSGPGLVEQVIQTRKPLRMTAAEAASRLAQPGAADSPSRPRAYLGVPLIAGGRVLGMIGLQDFRPQAAFSDQQERIAVALADQLAVALDNLRLAEDAQRALSELDAVNRLLTGRAWQKYASGTGALFGEWRGGQWLVETAGPSAILAGDRSPASNLQPPTLRAEPQGEASPLKLQVQVRGETVGEFELTLAGEGRAWEPEDVAFAQTLVDQVGQVIETARLLQETERLAARERTINEINSRVRQSVNLDSILQAAVTGLGRSLGAARVFVQL